MKEKWSQLPTLRRVLLIVTIGLPLLFALLYPIANSHKGLVYSGDFYRLKLQGGARVYTGTDHGQRLFTSSNPGPGKKTVYTVTPTAAGYTVECEVEGKGFGPYRVETFPAAQLPEKFRKLNLHGGVEVWRDGELVFRGGYGLPIAGYPHLINEKADVEGTNIYSNPIPVADLGGPSCEDVYYFALAEGEKLTHRGAWSIYAVAVFAAVLNALSIFYAEEMFEWYMSIHIKEPDKVEPSEWELFSRRLGWYLLLGVEVFALLYGLFHVV